jgi:hypothetical protein
MNIDNCWKYLLVGWIILITISALVAFSFYMKTNEYEHSENCKDNCYDSYDPDVCSEWEWQYDSGDCYCELRGCK